MTLDEWIKEIDACAERDLYFEVSGKDAGDLSDQIKGMKHRSAYFERAYMAARKLLDSKGIHMDYFLSRADYEAE
jgi:hypothetical protein